jgi:hypothetical protein
VRTSRHAALTALAVLAALLVAAPGASATLRSPHLESSCSEGFEYGEYTFANWTVEGCNKVVTATLDHPKGLKASRTLSQPKTSRAFRGNVEVNGMIVEVPDSGPDLIASLFDNGSSPDTGVISRSQSTTIVLDPLVNGNRKRFPIYTGSINLTTTKLTQAPIPEPTFGSIPKTPTNVSTKRVERRRKIGPAAVMGIVTDYIDIPTNNNPKIFGLRLRDGIHDAAVRPQNGGIPATIVFNAKLALLSDGLSKLLDVNGDTKVTLTDGVGLTVDNLSVKFPDIAVPGIGGLKNMHVKYNGATNVWSGGLKLDLGDLFPILDFETAVDADTGALEYIRTSVDNLPPIPIGTTGIFLDSVQFGFGLDPLFISAGAGATAGPTIAGQSLILLNGNVEMQFEPNFRLEVSGGARVLPSGNGELASGTFNFVYDADGLIAASGDARFEATVPVLDIGIGARIHGSGAYATDGNRFNIKASADGDLILGFLGTYNVAHFEAVISDHGFGTCGKLLGFLSGGIGQDWDNGGLKVFTGCDLKDFDDPIQGTFVHTSAVVGTKSRTFPVADGTKKVAVQLTSGQPGPHVTLRDPDGHVRVVTTAGQHEQVDSNTIVVGKPDATQQLIEINKPQAGDWKVEWGQNDPQITALQTAVSAPEIAATATVTTKAGDPPGQRRISITRTGSLPKNRTVLYSVDTPNGLVELGPATSKSKLNYIYPESVTEDHDIVATPVRNGIPIANKRKVIGHYAATVPGHPKSIKKTRKGDQLTLNAKVADGTEAPDAWQYRVEAPNGNITTYTAKPGTPLTISVPTRIKSVKVTARAVLRGRALQ